MKVESVSCGAILPHHKFTRMVYKDNRGDRNWQDRMRDAALDMGRAR